MQRSRSTRRLSSNPELEYYERFQTEPFKSEEALREAIVDWEKQTNRISKTRFYWLCGVAFLVVGLAVHQWGNRWVGTAALIVAFSEMIYWSSPSYFSAALVEYQRLLGTKIALASISVVSLLATARVIGALGPAKDSPPRPGR